MRARDLRWLTDCAHSPHVNDNTDWYRVLSFMGLSIPDFPADLLVLAGPALTDEEI